MSGDRQTAVGVGLAALLFSVWGALHVYSVFFHPLEGWGLWTSPLLMLAMIWLNVGLFIIAHDCMHGSLAPSRPRINAWIGRTALVLYAGFSYARLRPKHMEHHRKPGMAGDPDFSEAHPRHFLPWYLEFLRQYFGWRELSVLVALASFYHWVLAAHYASMLLFWAVPAILSSVQLFFFGTFLPHRHGEIGFTDEHNARSNDFGWLVSLLTCFHFGYHLEHHRSPGTPWWRLPSERVRTVRPR